MFQIISKAININTKEIIYEGVKKEYDSYWEAARALKNVVNHNKNYHSPACRSRIPENYREDVYTYVSWTHWGSIRTTLYLKKICGGIIQVGPEIDRKYVCQ